METLNRLATRLKIYNVPGSVMHHVAIFKRILDRQNISSEIIKGYCVIMESKESCEHYWVRTSEGLDLDIAFTVARLKSPELQSLHPVLVDECPPGLTRSDLEASDIREENNRLFELYQQDPKAFWRESPRDVSSFHLN
jgi:hypothetical protein